MLCSFRDGNCVISSVWWPPGTTSFRRRSMRWWRARTESLRGCETCRLTVAEGKVITSRRCSRRICAYGSTSRRTGRSWWKPGWTGGKSGRSRAGSDSCTSISTWGRARRGSWWKRTCSTRRFCIGGTLKELKPRISEWDLRSWGFTRGFCWFLWFWTGPKRFKCLLRGLQLLSMIASQISG